MKNKFLHKLKKEGKLDVIVPSIEICNSYSEKSINCIKSGKILLKNELYENSVIMSYYAMYNVLLGLLFRVGIKCENHSGSILILELLFKEKELHDVILRAKKERIDKQYYITDEKDSINKEIADELLINAEDFVLKTRLLISKMSTKQIENILMQLDKIVS